MLRLGSRRISGRTAKSKPYRGSQTISSGFDFNFGFLAEFVRTQAEVAALLAVRLYVRGVFWKVRLKLDFVDLQVLHHVRVPEQEVVSRARFEELLLHRQPRRGINPHLNLGYLL